MQVTLEVVILVSVNLVRRIYFAFGISTNLIFSLFSLVQAMPGFWKVLGMFDCFFASTLCDSTPTSDKFKFRAALDLASA